MPGFPASNREIPALQDLQGAPTVSRIQGQVGQPFERHIKLSSAGPVLWANELPFDSVHGVGFQFVIRNPGCSSSGRCYFAGYAQGVQMGYDSSRRTLLCRFGSSEPAELVLVFGAGEEIEVACWQDRGFVRAGSADSMSSRDVGATVLADYGAFRIASDFGGTDAATAQVEIGGLRIWKSILNLQLVYED